MQTTQCSTSGIHLQSSGLPQGAQVTFVASFLAANTVYLSGPSQLQFTVTGISGGYHMAPASPKLIGSHIATGLSLGALALLYSAKSHLSSMTPNAFKTNTTWMTLTL